MLGGTSRFFANTNGVGIGTTSPLSTLEVSNALAPGSATSTTLATYLNAFGGSSIIGQRARGTAAAPAAILSGDGLLELSTRGYNGTAYSLGAAAIAMGTSENWTTTAQGTQISFWTTANGTATPGTRMRIAPSGNVGIGTFSPISLLEVSNSLSTAGFAQATVSSFANSSAASLFVGSKARGTGGTPAAVQLNDNLAGFLGRGYGLTTFSGTRGGMRAIFPSASGSGGRDGSRFSYAVNSALMSFALSWFCRAGPAACTTASATYNQAMRSIRPPASRKVVDARRRRTSWPGPRVDTTA